jgi:hypothetical protein
VNLYVEEFVERYLDAAHDIQPLITRAPRFFRYPPVSAPEEMTEEVHAEEEALEGEGEV